VLTTDPGGTLSEEKPHASDVEMLVTLFKLYVHQLWAMRELLIEKAVFTSDELNQTFKRLEAERSFCGGFETASSED